MRISFLKAALALAPIIAAAQSPSDDIVKPSAPTAPAAQKNALHIPTLQETIATMHYSRPDPLDQIGKGFNDVGDAEELRKNLKRQLGAVLPAIFARRISPPAVEQTESRKFTLIIGGRTHELIYDRGAPANPGAMHTENARWRLEQFIHIPLPP